MDRNVPILLWVGASQVGKSSAIKLLTDDQSIVCGVYGEGGSTTYQIKIYEQITHKLGQPYQHMDSIGLGDNRLKYDDNQIMNQIEMEILRTSDSKNINEVAAIIATQSFLADAYKLPQVFLQIRKMFNMFPAESIIVLATKKNTATLTLQERRKNQLKTLMREYGIPESHYLEFGTPCPDADFPIDRIDNEQFAKLSQLIHHCRPVELKQIKKKHEMLKQRAAQIMDQKTRDEKVQFMTDKVTLKTVQRTQNIEVPYHKPSSGLLGIIGGVTGAVFGGGIGAVAGSGLGSMLDKPKSGMQSIPFSYEQKVPEIHQQKVTRDVKNVPEFQYCYQQALREYEKESRNQMIRN